MDLGARVRNKHVLVTGASSGLGEHFARLLARCGASVTIAARRIEKLDRLADALKNAGAPHVRSIALDVTDDKSIASAIEKVAADGAPPLDVLVNNAGVASTEPALAIDGGAFDHIVDTNLRGPWLLSVAAAKQWSEAKRPGVIVNIASILGLNVSKGVAPYAVSKAGVVQMTKAMALEWARYDIRVNALCPGYVETELNAEFFASEPGKRLIQRIPMRRLGKQDELDGAFLLLASDASSWMTGTALTIDGGHLVAGL